MKKTLKRVLCLVFALAATVAVAGCGNGEGNSTNSSGKAEFDNKYWKESIVKIDDETTTFETVGTIADENGNILETYMEISSGGYENAAKNSKTLTATSAGRKTLSITFGDVCGTIKSGVKMGKYSHLKNKTEIDENGSVKLPEENIPYESVAIKNIVNYGKTVSFDFEIPEEYIGNENIDVICLRFDMDFPVQRVVGIEYYVFIKVNDYNG